MLDVTSRAVEALTTAIAKTDRPQSALRVFVSGFG